MKRQYMGDTKARLTRRFHKRFEIAKGHARLPVVIYGMVVTRPSGDEFVHTLTVIGKLP